MKLELEIDDPKYKVGDFVLLEKSFPVKVEGQDHYGRGKIHVIGHIYDINFDINIRSGKPGKADRLQINSMNYCISIQDGSKTVTGKPIRPGTIVYIGVYDDEDETILSAFEYKGTVIEPDTHDNIMGRWEEWAKLHPESENLDK